MQLRTTSIQRTYRYVRLSIIGVIALIGVSVTVQIVIGGPLTSVSAVYFTPARNVFVGALFAVCLALLALSGRSIEQALLDLAAILAPVIAVVPTPVESGDVSGVAVACPHDRSCVPPELIPDVVNGVLSLTAIGILGLIAALVLARVQRTLSVALIATFAAAGLVIAAFFAWWLLGRESFLLAGHYVATIGFFGLVAVVAALAAFRPTGAERRHRTGLRIAYSVISAGIVVSLVVVGLVVALRAGGIDLIGGGFPLFFVGEAAALLAFAAFWTVQTIELWNEPDPALRVRAS